MFYVARCMNIIFNELRQQLVKYDVDTTRKIKFIHAIFYAILLFYYLHTCCELHRCLVYVQASARQLSRSKVPVVCAVIDSVTARGVDAGVTLRDPTGS